MTSSHSISGSNHYAPDGIKNISTIALPFLLQSAEWQSNNFLCFRISDSQKTGCTVEFLLLCHFKLRLLCSTSSSSSSDDILTATKNKHVDNCCRATSALEIQSSQTRNLHNLNCKTNVRTKKYCICGAQS